MGSLLKGKVMGKVFKRKSQGRHHGMPAEKMKGLQPILLASQTKEDDNRFFF